MADEFDYDIALSFAGEDRAKVEPVADLLKKKGVNVFYDEFEQSRLWGEDLYAYLDQVYSKKARFCVMFLSRHYAEKAWTNHERKSAQERAFREHKAYILPLRLDDTEIPGVRATVGYIDYRKTSAEQIVDLILEKLDHSDRASVELTHASTRAMPFNIPMPKIRKTFTQREKDKFGQEAFAYIMQYFEAGLKLLQENDPDIETEFIPRHRHKFAAKIYMKGEVANACKVWLGGWAHSGSDHINFQSGRHIDLERDNTMNDSITVTDDGYQLLLELGGLGFSVIRGSGERRVNKEKAAEYLWQHFLEPLTR